LPCLTSAHAAAYAHARAFLIDGFRHYLGWLALALTPGLGARMAGKLLREMGSPHEIFNASLTELESHHLPAAVAQAIHSRRPLSDAAKELAAAQAAGCKLLTWDEPEIPHPPARNLRPASPPVCAWEY
jgi:predicted Rossmann fold nucleotide-binding protein DprA/Smf involved in DNA uptake